ncbi:MAG: SemiSWEET transporter [Chitinophagaceae bacterium]|nr:SemiSWEET transporter [Chitinophagaceae bacterium]MBL0055823.1 SemiSWEET transporter [Chitinophagaceae bacterium]
MDAIELLGMTAGTISSITFLPQVIKTWQTKSAKDISLWMFLLVTLSVILWLVYGIFLKSVPIIYTNSAVLLMSLVMLYFKWKFDK